MFSAEDFDLASTWTHPLNHPVHFIWFPTRLSDFGDNDVGIKTTVSPRGELEIAIFIRHSLHSNEHMLFGVIQPVTGSSSSDNPLKLRCKGLDPEFP